MTARAVIPAVTLAVTFVCSVGLDVPVTVFVAVWAGLSVFAFGLWRFWLAEAVS